MKWGMKCLLCGMLASQMICSTVFAAEPAPCYTNEIDRKHSDFDKGLWKYQFTSDSGGNILLEEGKKHTFLIVNGNISAGEMMFVQNKAYAVLTELCHGLQLSVKEDADSIVVENGTDVIKLDKKMLTVEKNQEKTEIKGMAADGKIYVPVREFAALLQADIVYQKSGIMPMFNPLIDVDNRKETISKEQAVQAVKEKLTAYYAVFEKESQDEKNPYYTYYTEADAAKAEIQEKTKHAQCVGETAGFWIVKASLYFLVDKADSTIYVKFGEGKAGHGSYMESIHPLEEMGAKIFSYILIRGGV